MALKEELGIFRMKMKTDGYEMSVGEWISLYEKGEVKIDPAYRQFFRWSDAEKTRLVESALLGLPLPPVVVVQWGDGVWEVVDGLQRLSTIYQLAGILRDENGDLMEPWILSDGKFLPSLKGKAWEPTKEHPDALEFSQRASIRRATMRVNILLPGRDDFFTIRELIEHFNTGGLGLAQDEN